jgi:hypothetical protein
MTIETNNRGRDGGLDKDGLFKCQDCGETYRVEHIPALENSKECPTCRQNRVNETLRYIKELLNDSSNPGK